MTIPILHSSGRISIVTQIHRHFVKLPWCTVFGNHDMVKSYSCPCDGTGTDSHQTHTAADSTWIMPNSTYLVPMPELNIEFIGLYTNFDWDGETCMYAYCGNSMTCYYNLLKPTAYADTNFVEQYEESTAKTLEGFIRVVNGLIMVCSLATATTTWSQRLCRGLGCFSFFSLMSHLTHISEREGQQQLDRIKHTATSSSLRARV